MNDPQNTSHKRFVQGCLRRVPASRLRLAFAACFLLLQPIEGCRTATARQAEIADANLKEEQFQRQQLQSELRDAIAEQASFADALQVRRQEAMEIEARAELVRQTIGELDTAKRAYMQEHSTAVAAILAGAASGDVMLDKETSDGAKEVAVGVGVVALLWAATHQEELQGVVSTLQNAKSRRETLVQEIQSAESERNTQRGLIDTLKLQEDKAREKVSALRTALCGAGCGSAS